MNIEEIRQVTAPLLTQSSQDDLAFTTEMWISKEDEAAVIFASWRFIEARSHKSAADNGWWTDLKTGESLIGKRNVPELLCLIHSEISEAMEAHRKGLMDDKLPHRPGIEVELADAILRIADLGKALNLDVAGALVEKDLFNRRRADHKPENRRREGGKAY